MNSKFRTLFTLLSFSAFVLIPVERLFADFPTAQIIDGTPVSENLHPYVARLMVDGELQCTGTLVGSRYILTAGHCFYDGSNNRAVGDTDMVVRLGGQQIRSKKVHIHPSFKPRSSACVEGEVDAAVIELSSAPSGISAIPLLSGPLPLGTSLFLMGYGTQGQGSTGQDGTIPDVGVLNIGTTVLEGYGTNPPAQESDSIYLYWTFDAGEANTASGDSGGPAFYLFNNELYLAGITCGGDGNAEFGTLSFDTRADVMKAWVDAIIGSTPAATAPSFPAFATQNVSLGQTFSLNVMPNGTQPITVLASGLPEGLVLNGSVISGAPTVAGTYEVQLAAGNAFGNATATLTMVVTAFSRSMNIQKVLLQFDYEDGANDFLDISGKISLGPKFKPSGKTVTVRIGRFTKEFRLRSNGESAGGGKSFFDLEGAISGSTFRKSSAKYFLTLERTSIFDEIATLGFPSTANASEGQEVPLPLSININGVESSSTATLIFRARDGRWRKKP